MVHIAVGCLAGANTFLSHGPLHKSVHNMADDFAQNEQVCQSLSHVRLFATLWTVAPQVSSVHGILQGRLLEWVAISYSRKSKQGREQEKKRKTEATVFCNLFLEKKKKNRVIFTLFYLYEVILGPAQVREKRIIHGNEQQRQGSLGTTTVLSQGYTMWFLAFEAFASCRQ